MKIKLIKFNDNLHMPSRKHYNDAGADVYCPTDYTLFPHSTTKIPLGFGIEVPDGHMGVIFSRSSLSSEGIVCEMPPIDSGYRGEIHAVISNLTDNKYYIHKNDRIGQLVIMPIIVADFAFELGDERNTGAFGSTNINKEEENVTV